jgi:hydrogenase nickel incorporation protein HypB
MCQECGCGSGGGEVHIGGQPLPRPEHAHPPAHAHPHSHEHGGHSHTHAPSPHQILNLTAGLLDKNALAAGHNRAFFATKKLLTLNVVSSPGSGKTTLLQETAKLLHPELRLGVIVGDLATDNDARRLREAGVPVVQITTGTLCHLEAGMITRALDHLNPDQLDVLIIENVGNLVCPADFDLGEHLRVVLLSVTEGEDKPLKYQPMFHSADVAIITKTDMAAAASFNRAQALANLHQIAHHARILELSARTGEGMSAWLNFLREQQAAMKR